MSSKERNGKLLKIVIMDEMIRKASFENLIPDSFYDRNEDVSIEMEECSTCNGLGKEFYSDCCGESIIGEKCTQCNEDCIQNSETCGTCNGEGQVEV